MTQHHPHAAGMHTDPTRDDDGELRRKRGDTLVRTIEEQYGVDFGVRGDMHLDALRQRTGAQSIAELLHHGRAR